MTEPRPEIDVNGTLVSFLHRDIGQITDAERANIEALVAEQQHDAGSDMTITHITIKGNQTDPDRVSYTASYRVTVTETGPDAEAG